MKSSRQPTLGTRSSPSPRGGGKPSIGQASVGTITGISLGSALFLVRDTDLYRHFAPFGLSKRGFTGLLSVLGIPYIYISDEVRLVNFHVFVLAFYNATRIGRPDFMLPGVDPSKHPRATKQAPPAPNARELVRLVDEVLALRKLTRPKSSAKVRRAFESAADRIAASMLQFSVNEQTALTKEHDHAA